MRRHGWLVVAVVAPVATLIALIAPIATLIAIEPSAHAERHIVQRGETLEHVAVGHGCTIEALQRANHLTTSLPRPGTSLEIPSCSILSRSRARSLRASRASDATDRNASAATNERGDRTASAHVDATSPDTDKARHALAVIDGATWIDTPGPRVEGRERDRVARDDDSAAATDARSQRANERANHSEDIGDHGAANEPVASGALWNGRPGAAHEPAASVGAPWDGRLEHAAHLEAGDGYDVRRPARAYGADHVVAHLRHVIAEVRALYPDVHTLAIGDISAEHGGHISQHRSHQSGLDVDVGFYFHRMPAGYPATFVAADANLDLEATWALLTAFARTAERDNGVEMIFLDYAVQRRLYDWAKRRGTPDAELEFLFQYPRGADAPAGLVRHWAGHENHMHVRFKP